MRAAGMEQLDGVDLPALAWPDTALAWPGLAWPGLAWPGPDAGLALA